MKLGIAYYPEHHKPDLWEKHMRLIKEAGIERIRIGEFAWSRLQPAKGVYNWDWLDQSIELAGRYGIEVVLCTPTACPPIWLVEEYPEVLPVNKFGDRLQFGKRQHRCYNAPAYIEHSRDIVERLGQRYGGNPNVVAWQLDNEFGGEEKECYCDFCKKAFHEYLENKYHTIEELNDRWGNYFWSQDYQRWDQIPVPLRIDAELLLKYNPSLELEFLRFSSDSIVRFARMQASILRKYARNQIITTNTDTFYYGDNVNLLELFRDLDIGAIDVYSDRPHEVAFYADFMRSIKGDKFWMLEFPAERKNMAEGLELLKSHNCEFVSFFKLNPFPAGQEQGTKALLTLTGEPTGNYWIVKKWAEEQKDKKKQEEEEKAPPVGLYYDFDSSWTFTIASWGGTIVERSLYPRYMLDTVYYSLYRAGCRIRFVLEPDQIRQVDCLLLPWQILYKPELEKELIDFVKKGGRLVVTDNLFQKNEDNVYLTSVPKIYRELLNWHENNFIYPDENRKDPVILREKAGKGQTLMIRSDAGREDWEGILREIL